MPLPQGLICSPLSPDCLEGTFSATGEHRYADEWRDAIHGAFLYLGCSLGCLNYLKRGFAMHSKRGEILRKRRSRTVFRVKTLRIPKGARSTEMAVRLFRTPTESYETRDHSLISRVERAFRQPRERLSILVGADTSGRTRCPSPNQPRLVPDSGPTKLSISASRLPQNTRSRFGDFTIREYICILHIIALAMKGLLLRR